MLPKIKVATPCPADWDKMVGDDKVRFCSSCQLNVYNFSAMTEPEVLKLVQTRTGRLCARFYQRADGTLITPDCPVGVRAAWRKMTRLATAALAMIFVTPFAKAQMVPINPPEPVVQVETQQEQIKIHVINRLAEPVRGATVELQDKSFNLISRAETDRHGNAHFAKPRDGAYILVVRAPLLMTYSRVLAFSGVDMEVTVQASAFVTLGVLSGDWENPATQTIPMPMHGIPDVQRTSPKSVR